MMVKIGRHLLNADRVDAVVDYHNRAARPGVTVHMRGGAEYWIERVTLDEVEKILDKALEYL